MMVICQKNVPIDLGTVQNYRVVNATYDSLWIKWEPPKTSWKIKSYSVTWTPQKWNGRSKDKGNSTLFDVEYKITKLKPERTYVVSVAPFVIESLTGNYEEVTSTTLEDTRSPLQFEINEDGEMTIVSPKFMDKEGTPINITLYEIGDTGKEIPVEKVIGKPSGTSITGLKPGANYTIKVNVNNEDEDEPFNHTTNFIAYPTCKPEQIQKDLDCFWIPEEKKPWRDAISLCRQSGGGLVDPSLNNNPRVKSLFNSQKSSIWTDMRKSSLSKEGDQLASNCSDSNEDALCCSYDVYPNGTTGNVECTCCTEEKSFVCKTSRNLNLGSVRNLRVSDKLENSIIIQWDPPEKSWKQLSYLVTWTKSNKKRETNDMIVNTEKATVEGLKPNTKYIVGVSPHINGVSSGKSVEVDVSTAALNLGEVQDLKVVNVTETSLTIRWNPPTRTWNNLAYLVTWSDKTSSRKRRETKEKVVTKNEVTVSPLKSNTSYKVGVTPYVDNTAAGNTKEISVTTTSRKLAF
ncbi:receptor-type tyrosine-protein phosphatase H-like [Centruroides sculpturatus]|uniref:receptor-type tyrosine-protein phosphatase H-like n=1 Tax=Centruroides sculpturatus TaxID=218467 RepID=UPI000C6DE42B|nr:receptor-type tyrosine-protein phosphatase H-like [Centruroides sculpturatus]